MRSVIKKRGDLVVLLILVFAIGIFFHRLFFPQLSIFVTPDFGQSDLFQLNYPGKFSLYEALHNNTLPFWNKYIGTGFPQLAEGQMGAFNIINLALYNFLPFIYAINIGYILIFLTTASGTFFYLRFLKHSRLVSFLGTFLFTFSSFFVSHMAHINLIQASSFLPWVFLFSHRYMHDRKKLDLIILALILSQQFFAGFPQISFITLCGVGLLYLFGMHQKDYPPKNAVFPLLTIALFICLSAVQILPSQEFLKYSTRKEGFVLSKATQYSFPWGHFVTFINPNFFGTPQDGSFPPLTTSRGSIYWENAGYIGIIPLVLAMISLFVWKQKKYVRFYSMMLITSGLLMTGSSSPIYLIYSFFPFNYFRVPSRFILLFIWALIMLSAYGFSYLQKKKLTTFSTVLVVTLSCLQLWLHVYDYNPIGNASEWLKEPVLSAQLPAHERYFSISSGLLWNRYFYSKGWIHTEPYRVMSNYLRPNINLLFHKDSYQVYPILLSNRYSVINGLLEENVGLNSVKETFDTNDISKKLMAMNNIGTIVSHYGDTDYKAFASVPIDEEKIFLYHTDPPLSRARIMFNYDIVETVEQLKDTIARKDFDPSKTVLLEKNLESFNEIEDSNQGKSEVKWEVQWKKDTHTDAVIETSSDEPGILVVADLYFPGWKARVDGKEQEILPANGAQRAVRIPSGKHTVEFLYQPASFTRGLIISSIAHLFIAAAIFVLFFSSTRRRLSATR